MSSTPIAQLLRIEQPGAAQIVEFDIGPTSFLFTREGQKRGMGIPVSRVFDYFSGKEEVRILMVGLDAAGKTTILYKLKLGEIITTIQGFCVERVKYKNVTFTVWDLEGQGRIHAVRRQYSQNSQGVIFVVDSSDQDRISQAREELHRLLNEDELRNAVWLVFANKQDLPYAMTAMEVAGKLRLHGLKQRTWQIQATCATSGDGLYEGLEWLNSNLRRRMY